MFHIIPSCKCISLFTYTTSRWHHHQFIFYISCVPLQTCWVNFETEKENVSLFPFYFTINSLIVYIFGATRIFPCYHTIGCFRFYTNSAYHSLVSCGDLHDLLIATISEIDNEHRIIIIRIVISTTIDRKSEECFVKIFVKSVRSVVLSWAG